MKVEQFYLILNREVVFFFCTWALKHSLAAVWLSW